ncbi:MAG: hypothetical protein AAF662_03460 [Pseudomonadota bacterium]
MSDNLGNSHFREKTVAFVDLIWTKITEHAVELCVAAFLGAFTFEALVLSSFNEEINSLKSAASSLAAERKELDVVAKEVHDQFVEARESLEGLAVACSEAEQSNNRLAEDVERKFSDVYEALRSNHTDSQAAMSIQMHQLNHLHESVEQNTSSLGRLSEQVKVADNYIALVHAVNANYIAILADQRAVGVGLIESTSATSKSAE